MDGEADGEGAADDEDDGEDGADEDDGDELFGHVDDDGEGEGEPDADAGSGKTGDAFTRAFRKAASSTSDILGGEKVLARRRAEATQLRATQRERRRAKLAIREQCRVYPSRKGERPEEDAAEKRLARLATRGVVRLFNAVRAAQRAEADVDEGKARAAKEGLVRALEGTAVAPKVKRGNGAKPARKAGGGWDVLSSDAAAGAPTTGTRMRQFDNVTAVVDDRDADDVAAPEALFD